MVYKWSINDHVYKWCFSQINTDFLIIHVFKNMHQVALEENGEKKQVQLGKLEATIKSLSAELLKVCF